MTQALLSHEIVARKRPGPLRVAAPADFILGPGRPADEAALAAAIPYCIDFDTGRVLLTRHAALGPVLSRPFLYQAQYVDAQDVLTCPLEVAAVSQPGHSFLLVQSIGRCGSTLISRLLAALGLTSFSEPDAFSQLSQAARLGKMEGGALLRSCNRILGLLPAAAAGPEAMAAVKFRSFCSNIAVELQRAWPGSKSIFMVRGRHGWASSMYTTMRRSPEFSATKLRSALVDLRRLKRAAPESLIVNYDELLASPVDNLDRIRQYAGLSARPDPEFVKRILDEDSQSGTALARGKRAAAMPAIDVPREFDHYWSALRPAAVIEELGLSGIY